MKKLTATAILLIFTLILTSCGNMLRIPVDATIEAVQSNIGGGMLNQVMETDDGFYYADSNGGANQLRYYDKATGLDIYLCAKPQCIHDGSSFCPSTGGSFATYGTALYDGYLYIYGVETDKDGSSTVQLYRASSDGTSLDKIASPFKATNSYVTGGWFNSPSNALVIHRGKAFMRYHAHGEISVAGAGIIMVDLKTFKHKTVHHGFNIGDTVGTLKPVGDWLYFNAEDANAMGYIKRYNINTGETETLFDRASAYQPFAVIGDELWVTRYSDIRIINMVTGEERYFDGYERYRKANFDESNMVEWLRSRMIATDLMYDGTYFYMGQNTSFDTEGNIATAIRTKEVFMFDPVSEDLVAIFHYDDSNYTHGSGFVQMNVLDGKIYWQSMDGIDVCAIEDIISGDYEWTRVMEFRNMTYTPLGGNYFRDLWDDMREEGEVEEPTDEEQPAEEE